MGPLDPAEIGTTADNMLVDYVAPGAPLVITFGFFNATGPCAFNFWGRLKKLELLSGRPLNKLLLRDSEQHWYLGGIKGLGDDVPTTIDAIRAQIERMKPSCVITLGQSMGAYGAILYGTLLNVDKVICFGPLSCFDRRLWDLLGDARWKPLLDTLDAAGIDATPYHDLPALIAAQPGRAPEIDLIYGSYPGPDANRQDAVGFDAAHALRFAAYPNVTFLPVAHSLHAVVEYFRHLGVITQVLNQRIFGTSLKPVMEEIRTGANTWVAWLEENLSRGAVIKDLRPLMLDQLSAEQADYIIERAKLVTALQHFEDTPPRVTASLPESDFEFDEEPAQCCGGCHHFPR